MKTKEELFELYSEEIQSIFREFHIKPDIIVEYLYTRQKEPDSASFYLDSHLKVYQGYYDPLIHIKLLSKKKKILKKLREKNI